MSSTWSSCPRIRGTASARSGADTALARSQRLRRTRRSSVDSKIEGAAIVRLESRDRCDRGEPQPAGLQNTWCTTALLFPLLHSAYAPSSLGNTVTSTPAASVVGGVAHAHVTVSHSSG